MVISCTKSLFKKFTKLFLVLGFVVFCTPSQSNAMRDQNEIPEQPDLENQGTQGVQGQVLPAHARDFMIGQFIQAVGKKVGKSLVSSAAISLLSIPFILIPGYTIYYKDLYAGFAAGIMKAPLIFTVNLFSDAMHYALLSNEGQTRGRVVRRVTAAVTGILACVSGYLSL